MQHLRRHERVQLVKEIESMMPEFGNPYRRGLLSAASTFRAKSSWRGASGSQYIADVYAASEGLPLYGGVYLWVRRGQTILTSETDFALYIGMTSDFSGRMQSHRSENDKWAHAVRLGVTQIHLIPIFGDDAKRRAIEADLIAMHRPQLNDLVPRPMFGAAATLLGGRLP